MTHTTQARQVTESQTEADGGFDWQSFFFHPEHDWPDRLLRQSRKRFGDTVFAEEADTYAIHVLSDNGWAKLNEYDGKSKPGTFLVAAYQNALVDYHRSKFGRVRPPEWIKRLGTLWKEVFQLLCIKRWHQEQIVDQFCVTGERLREEIIGIVVAIRAKVPNCGASVGEVLADDHDDGEGPQRIEPAADALDTELESETLAQLLQAMAMLLGNETLSRQIMDEQCRTLRDKLQQTRDCLSLTPQEQLLLKLVYQDCNKVAKAARLLQQPEHQVRSALKRTLKRLKSCLEQAGFTADVLTS